MIGGSLSPGLSNRRISTGPVLPSNNRFAMFGDSRTAQGQPGLPQTLTFGGLTSIGVQGALIMKTGGLISFEPEISNFGISGQAINGMAQVPRVAYSTLGADVVAASAAQSVIILAGVNNTGDPQLAVGGTLWNDFISILARWNSKFRVYILNEYPVGKTAAGGLSGTMSQANAAVHYQFSRDMLKLDKGSGDALARANCVVINTYDAFIDAASGADRYNIQGLLSDGVHLSALGASTIANLMTASINATYPTAQRDPTKTALATVKDNSVLCLNGMLAVIDSTLGTLNTNFLTYNGGASSTGSKAEIYDYCVIGGTNVTDINLTVSKGTDDEGYPSQIIQWSRAAGGVAGEIGFTVYPDVLAVQQAKFTVGQKMRFQSKIKLDTPVGMAGILAQGSLRSTGFDDVGSITSLGHLNGNSGLPVVAFPWMAFEGRDAASATYMANSAAINTNGHQCQVLVQFAAGATSGTFSVSRMTIRRYA